MICVKRLSLTSVINNVIYCSLWRSGCAYGAPFFLLLYKRFSVCFFLFCVFCLTFSEYSHSAKLHDISETDKCFERKIRESMQISRPWSVGYGFRFRKSSFVVWSYVALSGLAGGVGGDFSFYTMFPSVRILRCIQSCLILRIGLVEDWNSSGQSKGNSLSKAIHVVAVWIGNPLFSLVYRRCRSVRAYEHVRFKILFWQPLISRQTSRRLSRRCPWEAAAGPC